MNFSVQQSYTVKNARAYISVNLNWKSISVLVTAFFSVQATLSSWSFCSEVELTLVSLPPVGSLSCPRMKLSKKYWLSAERLTG